MLNETNFYLGNLAIADICHLIVAGTRYLIDCYKTPLNLDYPFSTSVGCGLPTFIVYTTYFAAVWLITLVAVERYFAICQTFKHRGLRSTRRSILLVTMSWVSAALMALFSTPWKSVNICVSWPVDSPYSNYPTVLPNCEFICQWCEMLLIVLDGGQFIFAFILNSCLFGRIIQTLRRRPLSSIIRHGSAVSTRSRSESALSTSASMLNLNTLATPDMRATPDGRVTKPDIRSIEQQTQQVTVMLIVNTVIFFICLFPYAVVNNTDRLAQIMFRGGFLNPKWVGWFGKIMSLVNSAINPYIYSIFNRRYRLALKEAFNCRNPKKLLKQPAQKSQYQKRKR